MSGRDLRSGHSGRRQNRPGPPIITQEMLAEFRELRLLRRRYELLRARILQDLENGAVVEVGPLEVGIKETIQRSLTIAALVGLLGADQVKALRDSVEQTLVQTLVVTDRGANALRRPRQSRASTHGADY